MSEPKEIEFRYFIGQKIANGAFGQVRVVTDIITGEEMAVKLEKSDVKMPMLYMEYRFYQVNKAQKGSNMIMCIALIYGNIYCINQCSNERYI